MRAITVIACGTTVTTKLGKIEGTITCQSIRFRLVQYEITYILNGERKTFWADEDEFITATHERQKVGFKTK